jgi:hypothetical protein
MSDAQLAVQNKLLAAIATHLAELQRVTVDNAEQLAWGHSKYEVSDDGTAVWCETTNAKDEVTAKQL